MSELQELLARSPDEFLIELFKAGIAAARPELAIARNLPRKPERRCFVVGAGKASAAMARAVEDAWPEVSISGVVSTRYGHGVACEKVKVIEAGHPIPDDASMTAADEMLALLTQAAKDDLVLALISGGGSACLAKPREGLTLNEKQAITDALLKSGATIAEMNTVRSHLSQVKAGRLAKAADPARLVTLVISDVPGDDPSLVASGPTVPGVSTATDAIGILERYGIEVPPQIRADLKNEAQFTASRLLPVQPADCRIIASPMMALEAIAQMARLAGCDTQIVGDQLEGESSQLADAIAQTCLDHAGDKPRSRPLVSISGGETTVTLPKDCKANGGRNTEFQLAFAVALGGHPRIWSVAGDSDGIDGISDAAGALVSPDTLQRAAGLNIDYSQLLREHRSYEFFEQLDDLIKTGPTLTNVNDLRIQLIM